MSDWLTILSAVGTTTVVIACMERRFAKSEAHFDAMLDAKFDALEQKLDLLIEKFGHIAP